MMRLSSSEISAFREVHANQPHIIREKYVENKCLLLDNAAPNDKKHIFENVGEIKGLRDRNQ